MKSILIVLLATAIVSCSDNGSKSDAYGNFEATEYIISSEAAGRITSFTIEEGTPLEAGAVVGVIDTIQLHLNRQMLLAQRDAVKSKYGNIVAQIDVLNEQKKVAMKDKERIDKMFREKAATQKQLDDVNGRISVIEKQMEPFQAQNSGVFAELKSIDAQIEKIDDQIRRSIIINPVKGTVLNKYTEQYELVVQGKPLYKIADLDNMILRVYVGGDQLSKLRIGERIRVYIDNDAMNLKEMSGAVAWISPKAEFTPKIIQTKDERVNMVYAVKIAVKNDGSMKIGMPGEVKFN